jgi:hypothetical protein
MIKITLGERELRFSFKYERVNGHPRNTKVVIDRKEADGSWTPLTGGYALLSVNKKTGVERDKFSYTKGRKAAIVRAFAVSPFTKEEKEYMWGVLSPWVRDAVGSN